MKLICLLRVKNAKLTIKECLSKLSQLCDEIVIVDNGSTDGTLSFCKKFPKVVVIEKTVGFDEGRDKILAHELAKRRKPDWLLWLDADEIFERIATRQILEKYMSQPKLNLVKFRMFNFWLSRRYYRVDGIWRRYTAQPQRAMWRNSPGAYFRNLKFHNGGIQGVKGKAVTSYLRIKHHGYIDKRQIISKSKAYQELENDPNASKSLPLDLRDKHIKLQKWQDGYLAALYDWSYRGMIEFGYKLKQLFPDFKP